MDVRTRATGAWRGVEQRDRPQEVRSEEVEAALAERRGREAQREQEMARR